MRPDASTNDGDTAPLASGVSNTHRSALSPASSEAFISPETANETSSAPKKAAMPWWSGQHSGVSAPHTCAVAYYRHSAQERQKNSIQIQAEQVRAHAHEQGLRIIHEFVDRGRSGLTAEDRPGFMEMMKWVRERNDFMYILVLDVSRWGRFQDVDLSGYYELECRNAGKRVRFIDLGVPDDSPAGVILKTVHRITSAEESRIRGDKVFKGSVKVVEQGYRPGGSAPYGFTRAMITEKGTIDRILEPGDKKGVANWRVKLAPGDDDQVAVVQEIFIRFADEGLGERQIAGMLSARGVVSPGGGTWSAAMIGRILRDQQYAGAAVYNRTSKKLKTPTVHNPETEWVVVFDAHPGLVTRDLFERVQKRFAERQRCRDPDEMLIRLRALYERYGIVTAELLRHDPATLSSGAYASRFGSLPFAFQRLFSETMERVQRDVRNRIDAEVVASDVHDDFLVLDRKLTVLVQPSVPVPNGYGEYWVFRPDQRAAVDITLGVPLAGTEDRRILGYFPFPRLLLKNAGIRLTHSSMGYFALHGHDGLGLLRNILS